MSLVLIPFGNFNIQLDASCLQQLYNGDYYQ